MKLRLTTLESRTLRLLEEAGAEDFLVLWHTLDCTREEFCAVCASLLRSRLVVGYCLARTGGTVVHAAVSSETVAAVLAEFVAGDPIAVTAAWQMRCEGVMLTADGEQSLRS